MAVLFASTFTKAQHHDTSNHKKSNLTLEVGEIEIALAVEPHFGSQLVFNENFILDYKNIFKLNTFADYNVSKKLLDYTLSYDQKIFKNIYISTTAENDFFGEKPKSSHFKLGVKTYWQEHELFSKYVLNLNFDLGFPVLNIIGECHHRIGKAEFGYQVLTKPYWLNENYHNPRWNRSQKMAFDSTDWKWCFV